jgi:Domain of unknown function (DUF4258)
LECKRVTFSRHAVERMFERSLSPGDVRTVLEHGEVIAEFPDDTPFPSRLMLGSVGGGPLHVLVAFDRADGACIIVTTYRPDSALWEPDFKTRRSR